MSWRLPPRLPAWLAGGWVLLVAAIYWSRYDGWLLPVQLAHALSAAVPSWRVGPHFPAFAKDRLLDAGWLLLLFATAWPVGRIMVRPRGVLQECLAVGVGLALVSVATLLLATISTRWVGLVFAGAFLWLVPAARRFAITPAWPRGVEETGLAVIVVVTAGLNLPGALVPPFEYDELEYHLGAPAEYLREGRLVFLPHNFYSNLPQLAEMLYLLALATRSDVAAKCLHWCWGVLTVPVVVAMGARLGSRRGGWWAAVLFYAVPYSFDLSQTARVDLATGFYGALAAALCLGSVSERKWAALAAGCAVATKWTAIPTVLVPLLVLTALQTRRVGPVLQAVGWSLLPVLPWLGKNLVLAGNPVYPLFHSWLGGGVWSAEQTAVFASRHYPRWDAAGWWQLVERPWHYSFAEAGGLPLLVAAIPLVWLVRRGGRDGQAMAGAWCGLGFAGWFATTYRPWRFLWPMVPAGAVWVSESVAHAGRLVKGVLLALVATGWCWSVLNVVVDCGDPKIRPPRMSIVQHLLGQSDGEEFLRYLGGGVLDPIFWMNEHLPRTARVLYVGEARAYYARHTALWSTAFDQHPLQQRPLRELDVTHVYVNLSEWARLARGYGYLRTVDGEALWDELRRRGREIYRTDRQVVYELRR